MQAELNLKLRRRFYKLQSVIEVLVNSHYWRYFSVSSLVTLGCVPCWAHTLLFFPTLVSPYLSGQPFIFFKSPLPYFPILWLPPHPTTLSPSILSHFYNTEPIAITTYHQLKRTPAFTPDIHICNKLNHIKLRPSTSLSHLRLPISLQTPTGWSDNIITAINLVSPS